MKMIQLRYLAKGKRVSTIDMHGFEGLARKPIVGFHTDGNSPLKAGEVTSAYTVPIPPTNLFEIIDTQNNRLQLRKSTQPTERYDEVQRYDEVSGKYITTREKITIDPAFKVMNDVDIFEDIAPVGKAFSEEEVQERIAEALKHGVKKEKTKIKIEEPIDEPLSIEVVEETKVEKAPKIDRWAKKVAPVG